MSVFDDSLALEPAGAGQWRALASPRYEAVVGMFGGWTVALLLKAVLEDPAATGSAISITVDYIAPIPPESALLLRTNCLGTTRSLGHWRCDLVIEGTETVAATAMVILANRRDSDGFSELPMPAIAPPEALEPFFPPFSKQPPLESRSEMPPPPFNKPDTRTLSWEKEASGRAIDVLTLALLSDLGAPRIFLVSAGPRPSATLTLSLTFLAGEAELAACGDDFILSEMVATRIEQSIVGSRKTMWSRAGTALATSEQLCWFR
ncbi:MAG: thioesterase family protein [Sandarakinorhabdus sp.]|nr:thioesterase family protein [Sandarakinorhabdus sp.]